MAAGSAAGTESLLPLGPEGFSGWSPKFGTSK
jgi:hypothetical protein